MELASRIIFKGIYYGISLGRELSRVRAGKSSRSLAYLAMRDTD